MTKAASSSSLAYQRPMSNAVTSPVLAGLSPVNGAVGGARSYLSPPLLASGPNTNLPFTSTPNNSLNGEGQAHTTSPQQQQAPPRPITELLIPADHGKIN